MSAVLIGYDDLATKGIRYSRAHLWRLEKAGGWLSELAKHGKANQAVDKVFTEEALQMLFQRFYGRATARTGVRGEARASP